MYTLGSHNSFSYLPIKKWHMKWIRPWVQCQSKDIFGQINAGARYFDMRVRFGKNGDVKIVHNSVEFKYDNLDDSLMLINAHNCHMRIVLDIRNKVDEKQEKMFFEYIKYLKENFPNIKLHVQIAARGWNDIPELSAEPFEITEKHVSVIGYNLKNVNNYLGIPGLYAKANNETLLKEFKGNCLFIDFI
jgi:hypothetical protein|nr:MAG TPA: hypothetical protein [Caudoviricetes sp.]